MTNHAEVEAAIDAVETAFRNDERVSAKLDALRDVIARRVAEARGHGLRELRAWTIAAQSPESMSIYAPRLRDEIDRLLAASAQSDGSKSGDDARLRELRAHAETVRKERDSRNRGGADDCFTDNARSRQRESEAIEWILIDGLHWLRDGILEALAARDGGAK